MKTFLKLLQCFILILCLTMPMACLVSEIFEMPKSLIICGMFGFPCGFIVAKLVL